MKFYLKVIFIAAVVSLSCTTKVSEWFLINAVPDQFRLVYYHNRVIPAPVVLQNRQLEDLAKTTNFHYSSVLKANIEEPYYALFYSNKLFSEYKDYNELKGFSFSPMREKIASELMAGKLCVMLYLTSGNKEKDEKGLQIVKNTIAASPFGDIITVMDLSRSSREEKHFVSMLLNIEDDLNEIHEPMLFGVFGRLRVLEPLLGKGISGENINLLLNYLTADCSCLIKDNLPGISILFEASWESPSPALVNKIFDENPHLFH
jgi:hypothetical protein